MKTIELNTLTFYDFDEQDKMHIELDDKMEGCFFEDLTKEQILELIEFLKQSLE